MRRNSLYIKELSQHTKTLKRKTAQMNTTTFSPESNTFPTLFPIEVNTKFSEILREGFALLHKNPEILEKIERDLDIHGIEKKEKRNADRAWKDNHTRSLELEIEENVKYEECQEDTESSSDDDAESFDEYPGDQLGIGRPRMKAKTVFLFMLYRGYFGSVTDARSADRIMDSRTIQYHFQIHGFGELPGASTIHDNVQAVSYETCNYIFLCQLADVKDQGIDDYKRLTLDSTAVCANSSWPVDSGVIYRLLDRAFRNSQSLSKYGVPNFMPWHTELWLSKISALNFRINVVSGKGAKVKRRGFYRILYTEAEKVIAHLTNENCKHRTSMETVSLPPTLAERLNVLRKHIENDIEDAIRVIGYSRRRVMEGGKIPNADKILSLSDGSAAFILKGDREPVLGYRPQVGRSDNGLVTVLYVPEGNAADSPQLVSLVEEAIGNTGVVPSSISADDGYCSANGVGSVRMIPGVDGVSISGSKGKRLISEEDWGSELYKEARRNRSSVESLIFTLKFVYGFGNLRRRGIDAVRIELLEKAIVHNLSRLAVLKKRRQSQQNQAA
jgi:hypothetical protein